MHNKTLHKAAVLTDLHYAPVCLIVIIDFLFCWGIFPLYSINHDLLDPIEKKTITASFTANTARDVKWKSPQLVEYTETMVLVLVP